MGRGLPGLLGLLVAAVVEEAGCGLVWALSPQLTAIYNADYTREFFARAPALAGLPALVGEVPQEPAAMVARLEAGLALMIAGYCGCLLTLHLARDACGAGGDRGTAATTLMVIGAAVFRVTLFALPGLFSTDVFSYVMYGRISAVYAENPYLSPPSAFAQDPFETWVFPFWRDQPSVYGPLWADLSWLVSRLTANLANFDQVSAYRVVIQVFDIATLVALWWLLGRIAPTTDRARSFALYAWNPLVMFDLTGASHNDVVMLALLLLGIVALTAGSETWLAATGLSTLGALTKYATAIPAVMFTAALLAGATTWRERALRLAAVAPITLAMVLALSWPWFNSPTALTPITAAAGGKLVLNSAPDLVARTLADHASILVDDARLWLRTVSRAIFALYLLWEVVQLWRDPTRKRAIEASTRALLLLPLLVLTSVWSWYFTWSLVLAVLLGWRSPLAWLTVMYTLVALPIVYAHQYLSDELSGAFVMVLALGPPAVLGASRMLCARSVHLTWSKHTPR